MKNTPKDDKKEKKGMSPAMAAGLGAAAGAAGGVGVLGVGTGAGLATGALHARGRAAGAKGIGAFGAGWKGFKDDYNEVAKAASNAKAGVKAGNEAAAKVGNVVKKASRVAAAIRYLREHTTGENSVANRLAKRAARGLGFKVKLAALRAAINLSQPMDPEKRAATKLNARTTEIQLAAAAGWETRNGTPNSVRVVRSGYTRDRAEKPWYSKSRLRKAAFYSIGAAGLLAGVAAASNRLTKPPEDGETPPAPAAKPVAATPPADKPKRAPRTKKNAPGETPGQKPAKGRRPANWKEEGWVAPRKTKVKVKAKAILKKPPIIGTSAKINAIALARIAPAIYFARSDDEIEVTRHRRSKRFAEDPSLYGQAKRAGKQAGSIRRDARLASDLAGDLYDVSTGAPRDRRKKRVWEKARVQDRAIKGVIAGGLLATAAYAGARKHPQGIGGAWKDAKRNIADGARRFWNGGSTTTQPASITPSAVASAPAKPKKPRTPKAPPPSTSVASAPSVAPKNPKPKIPRPRFKKR